MRDEGTAGYSGTPLAKKLGINAETLVVTIHRPDGYLDWLGIGEHDLSIFEWPLYKLYISDHGPRAPDLVHLFTNSRDELYSQLSQLRNVIKQDGVIWVSWYKKAAKLPTEITEDTIRDAALPLGLVDVKVCAVDEHWSGLKLVIRKENRV